MNNINGRAIKILIILFTITLTTALIVSSFSPVVMIKNNNELLSRENVETNTQITAIVPDSDPTILSVDSVEIWAGNEETSLITITNVTDLAALQFSLTYDPEVVQISDVNPDGDLGTVNYNIDNVFGIFNVTWFDTSGIAGDHLLISNITFESDAVATNGDWCHLNFSNCVVANVDSQSVDYDLINGTATVFEEETPSEIILSIGSAEIVIGEHEKVSINASEAEDLAAFQINVTYDPTVVAVKEVNDTFSVFDEVNYYNHESLGILSLNSFNVLGFNGDLRLVDIVFEPAIGAVNGDITLLNLTNCILGDSESEPIEYETHNGTIMILSNNDPPELTVSKSVKLECCSPYEEEGVYCGLEDPKVITYNITIDGEGDFDSITVEDTLPLGVSFDEMILGDDPSIDGQILTWELGCKTGDWTETLLFTANITECGVMNNTVEVTGGNCGEIDIIAEDYAWVGVECEPDPEPEGEIIQVEKSVKKDCEECDFESSIGFDINEEVEFVTYKVDVYINDSFTEPIYNLTVRDTLPQLSGLKYNDSYIRLEDGTFFEDYTVRLTDDYIFWEFNNYVNPGSLFSIYYCADVIGCGDFENWVNVTGMYYDGGPCCPVDVYANDSAFVEVICGPGIDVTKEASLDGIHWEDESVESFVDDVIYFRLTIENDGYEILEGVNVYDYLPDFLRFKEMIDDGDADIVNTTCENQTYDLRWFFTEIDIGETITIIFTTDVIGVGTDENVVTAHDCPDPGEDVVGDTDDVLVIVTEGMHVEKQVYDENTESWTENISVVPGETVEWGITVSFFSSNETHILHHILINDTLPDELSYVEDSAMITLSNGTSFMMNPEIDDDQLVWDLNEEFLQSGDWLILTFETIVDEDCEDEFLENNVEVTGKVCDGTIYVLEDTATVYVTEPDNLAPEITSRSPDDGAKGVDIDADLSVRVEDAEDDLLTVIFYDASDDSVIEERTSVNPPYTVETTWENLDYNTTYEWYVTVSDGNTTITDETWNFTTIEEPTNQAPNEPYNPNPANNAQGIITSPTLSVHVSDPDGDSLDVTFYDADTDQVIGTDQCTSDCTASTIWTGLAKDTSYSWYVKVTDGEFEVESDTWSFTTETDDVDLEISSISGGMGITVEITNNGMDAADDVNWQISVENNGLIKRIDKTYTGTDDILGNDVLSNNIRLINFGRITVDVTVNHPSLDTPLTESASGFLFGFFVLL